MNAFLRVFEPLIPGSSGKNGAVIPQSALREVLQVIVKVFANPSFDGVVLLQSGNSDFILGFFSSFHLV